MQAEQGRRRGGGDAVLAGPGLGDDARLAHAPRQQRLADAVVDLVGAGVVEVLALEEDARPAGFAGQPLGEVQGRGPADVIAEIVVEEALELGIVAGLLVVFGGGAARTSAFRGRNGRRKGRIGRRHRWWWQGSPA